MIGILTARHLHVLTTPHGPRPVRTADDYAAVQRQWVAARRAEGWPIGPPVLMPRAAARVSGGNWLVDCPCGNAPLTDPEWGVAYCLACNAVFADVAFPADRAAIEAALTARPNPATRHWRAPETAADLLIENAVHGVEGS